MVYGIAVLAQRTQNRCDPTLARTCTPCAHATYTTKVVDQHVPHDDSPVRRRKVRQREQFWTLLAEAHEEVTWLRGMFTSMQQRLRASTRDGTVKPFHQLEVLALEEALHALRTREKTVSRCMQAGEHGAHTLCRQSSNGPKRCRNSSHCIISLSEAQVRHAIRAFDVHHGSQPCHSTSASI